MAIDFLDYMRTTCPEQVVLLHHWDTDGLASAALILLQARTEGWTSRIRLMHPQINNYFLTEAEYRSLAEQQSDAIVTVDLNFPETVIERLESNHAAVFVFDHHAQTAHINRPGLQRPEYPGCSFLVADYFLQPLSLLGVLGMIGDQEERIRERTAFYPAVEQMLQENDISFDDALRITKLIDTGYVLHDTDAMHHAIEVLMNDPKAVLSDEVFLANERKVAAEQNRVLALEPEAPRKGVRRLHIDSPASLISEVTRALSKRYPDDVIVTTQQYAEMSNIYVRRRNTPIDMSYIATEARIRGYNAGGKSEVTGIILPHADVEDMVSWIVRSLPV